MMGGFHGKTMGALSATWEKKYRDPFQPLIPNFKHVPPVNLEKVREAITEKTAAVLVEPIRGEGGVRLPQDGFLQGLREICDEKNVLLIFDEVQTSFGRTGKLFACEHWDIIPDVVCLAKPFAGGLPIGITVAKEHIMSSLKVGEHSSTFSGSPLVCAAACAAIDVLLKEKLAERATVMGEYFKAKLEDLRVKYKTVKEVRGLGLMIGVELRYDVLNVILKAMDRGILVLDAGKNILRFLPPLVIKKEQIDKTISVLDTVIGEEENERLRNPASN
jgi:acetylornithine/LysW-gamma-L-lysine aminotransferase